MQVAPVPCLKDNYAYLVWRAGSTAALVVDPSEARPVLAAASHFGVKLEAILCTHHHADHVGGNLELIARRPLPVYGHASDRGRIPGQTVFVEHEQSFELLGMEFRALHVPGHTRGAVTYVADGNAFTGDTLFAAGCGRLFEGTAKEMYESLNVKINSLPGTTRIYCGHEYTAANLRFAAHVEPENVAVREKAARVAALRASSEPSMPSTLDEERATNPFLRCGEPGVLRHVGFEPPARADAVAVLGALRAAKDRF